MAALKLLFIAHTTEPSGAPRVALNLAIGMRERGHEVVMCFPAEGGCEALARQAGLPTRTVDNPPVSLAAHPSPGLALARLRAAGRYAALVRELRPDCAWVSSSVAALAAKGAHRAGAPVVVQVHEDVVPGFANNLRVASIKKSADALCFVAERARNSFGDRDAHQDWSILSNFVDGEAFETSQRSGRIREECGVDPETFVFACTAFITERKGIDVLLRAWQALISKEARHRLWIAGGDAEASPALRKTIDKLMGATAMAATVSFLGHREDIPAILADADAYVLASRNEALPLSILEAMHAALPVVATDVGDVRKLVVDGETGFVVASEDHETMAQAMFEVGLNRKRSIALGENGRDLVRRNFSRAAILDQAEGIIRRAIEHHRGGAKP